MKSIPSQHEGVHYSNLIQEVCKSFQVENYLEIGVFTGENLAKIECSCAVGVDPYLRIEHNVAQAKRELHLIQKSSDQFFKTGDSIKYFPNGFDLAFLDGLHLFEYLFRDFIGSERISHNRSFIAIHDCLPLNAEMSDRVCLPVEIRHLTFKEWWTGDVWKILPILRKYRPDLCIDAYDCFPTGLAIIYNLDRNSTVLQDNYSSITLESMNLGNDQNSLSEFYKNQPVLSAQDIVAVKSNHRLFRF